MAIDISIVGDASDAIRSAERTGDALSDVVDELDRLDDAGKDAGAGVERGLKDAEDGAERFEDKMRTAFTEAERQASDAGRKIGTSSSEGFSKAGAATEEFRDEARQNIGETFSSFRGEVEDIPQLVQDVFGGVAPAMGGAGLLLTAGVAAGIGIAVSKAQELAQENTEAKETVAALAGEFIDLGGDLDRLDIAGRIREWGLEVNEDNWITFWVDEAETNFQKYSKLAEEAGVSTSESVRGMKGSYEDAQTFLARTTERREELTAAIEAGTHQDSQGADVMDASARAASRKRDALDDLRDGVRDNADQHREAKEIEEIYSDSVAGTREEIEAKNEALEEQADLLSDGIRSELEYKDQLADTRKEIKENGETLDTNTEKGRKNWGALMDLADGSREFRDAQMEAGVPVEALNVLMEEQREDFVNAAVAAGMEKDEAKALADQLGLVPSEVKTDFVETGATHVKQQAKDLENQPDIPVTVAFKPDTSEVDDARWWYTRNTVTQKVYFQPIHNLTKGWN